MTRYVVDSWAWVEYMEGSPAGVKADSLISRNDGLWTSVLSLAEVVSKYRRKKIDETPARQAISTLSRLGIPSEEDAIEAGGIHAEIKPKSPAFGLADCFVLQLARKLGAKVLTGDPDFRTIKEAEFIG
jgi:predicted nucleic acid-binding protein